MTKQLTLLLIAFFCYAYSSAFDSESPTQSTFESNSKEIKCQIISKIQDHKSGTDLNCNIRVQNISGKTNFIKSVILEFVIETENKKSKQKSQITTLVRFDKNWVIGNQDFAFYEPLKTQIIEGDKIKVKKIVSCKISEVIYQVINDNQENLKTIPFQSETTVGLISPVLLKLKFYKSSDSNVGYYKKGLKSKIKPAVRVDCMMKFENSGKSSVKIKDDISINFHVNGTNYKQSIAGFKINKSENIEKNISSVYFSNSVNPEFMQIFLNTEKSQLIIN